jgi:uncharacterized lipoprotein NlpE involved in copper resistance
MKLLLNYTFPLTMLMLLTVLITNCKPKEQSDDLVVDDALFEEGFQEENTARNSLDFQGIYFGILPCADCEGIETTIELGTGNAYTKTIVLLKNGDQETETSTGLFTWNEEGNTITLLEDDLPNQYFVGENILFPLDMDGNRMEGELADNYRLTKQ